jgi:hypothetical protein
MRKRAKGYHKGYEPAVSLPTQELTVVFFHRKIKNAAILLFV